MTEAEADKANKFYMQTEALMNQPSVLFASAGEKQYGRQRKSMQLQHLKHPEIKGHISMGFLHSLLLETSLMRLSLKKEEIP